MTPFSMQYSGLQDQLYEQIKERIVFGDFEPDERLNVDRLAREAGVSVTPVREALSRLVAEHLVLFRPNKGYRVMGPVDATRLADLFDVRFLLEPYAARLGAVKRSASMLSRLLEINERISSLDPRELSGARLFIRLNQDLHTLIVESAGNRALLELYTTLSYHAHIVLVYSQGVWDLPEILHEHTPILDAYRQRDGDAAEEAMREHILAGKHRTVGFLAEAQGERRKEVITGIR